MEQIIKFGISNYLQLCVEAGFSQIQSHFMNVILIALLESIDHLKAYNLCQFVIIIYSIMLAWKFWQWPI